MRNNFNQYWRPLPPINLPRRTERKRWLMSREGMYAYGLHLELEAIDQLPVLCWQVIESRAGVFKIYRNFKTEPISMLRETETGIEAISATAIYRFEKTVSPTVE